MNEELKALIRQQIAGYREVDRLHLEEFRRETPDQKLDATEEQERWAALKRAYADDPSILSGRKRR